MSIQQDTKIVAHTPKLAAADPLILGEGVRIAGAIYLDCDLILSGAVEGEVHCRRLKVESDGVIEGKVVAQEVNVRGRVAGEIYSPELTLRASCNVEAAIYYRALTLERGAFFEGKFRQSDDPLSLADG